MPFVDDNFKFILFKLNCAWAQATDFEISSQIVFLYHGQDLNPGARLTKT